MDTLELQKLSLIVIKNFVDQLGFDGRYYAVTNNCPIVFTRVAEGKFYTAKSEELAKLLSRVDNIPIEDKKKYFSSGIIAVNEGYKNKPVNIDLLSTIVHETFHSKRMLLLNSQYKEKKKYPSVFGEGSHFVQNTDSDQDYYADASQEIIKGSIDDSTNTIEKYKNLSEKEKYRLSFEDDIYDDRLEEQVKVDEALVELMTSVSCRLYKNKLNGIDSDIFSILNGIPNSNLHEDVKAMSRIILRHNDLELFKWMIDPLSYQQDYVNYDFFNNYITDEDKEDVQIIKEFMFDDFEK